MRPLPCFAWLSLRVLALVMALLVAPLLARSARPLAALTARPAPAPARFAYRTQLKVSAFPCLLLGALGLALYRRQRPRHWHPQVGLLSPVRVLPSGELSQPVTRYIWPQARRVANPRVS